MKKFFLAMLIALGWSGAIQAQFASTEGRVQKVITLKNGNMPGILRTIHELLPNTSVLVTSSDNEHVILSGPKEAVTGFEEIIKQLDVAPVAKKNIETTVYMVVASMQGSSAAVPSELDPVVKQLKGVFSYKGFRLLDSFVLRSRDTEKADTSGFVPSSDTNVPAHNKIIYQFQYGRVSLDGSETNRVIRYDRMKLGLKVPIPVGTNGQTSYMEVGISTDVDVPEGKKVVVGKTSAVEGADSALILVISAKVVD